MISDQVADVNAIRRMCIRVLLRITTFFAVTLSTNEGSFVRLSTKILRFAQDDNRIYREELII